MGDQKRLPAANALELIGCMPVRSLRPAAV